jgi:hypothetical protein
MAADQVAGWLVVRRIPDLNIDDAQNTSFVRRFHATNAPVRRWIRG